MKSDGALRIIFMHYCFTNEAIITSVTFTSTVHNFNNLISYAVSPNFLAIKSLLMRNGRRVLNGSESSIEGFNNSELGSISPSKEMLILEDDNNQIDPEFLKQAKLGMQPEHWIGIDSPSQMKNPLTLEEIIAFNENNKVQQLANNPLMLAASGLEDSIMRLQNKLMGNDESK